MMRFTPIVSWRARFVFRCVSGVLAFCCLAGRHVQRAAADSSAYTYYETSQSDQLSDDPNLNFVFEEDSDTQSHSSANFAATGGSLQTTYQNHDFLTLMGVTTNVGGPDVKLHSLRTHDFEGGGVQGTGIRWFSSFTTIFGQSLFGDQMTFTPGSLISPTLASVDFVFTLNGTYDHILDIRPGEQPLYRLLDRVRFNAHANGSVVQTPVNVDETTYDDDAGTPPFMWSPLDDDVNFTNRPIPNLTNRHEVLTVNFQQDDLGNYLPIDLALELFIESEHNFLNDGTSGNWYLKGGTVHGFSNSVDLIGVIVRDSTGAIRTDVNIDSVSGVQYSVLVPEPATLGILGLATMLLKTCKRASFCRNGSSF